MAGTSKKTVPINCRVPKASKAKLDTILEETGVSLTFVIKHYVDCLIAVISEEPSPLDADKLRTYIASLADRYGRTLALYQRLINDIGKDK